MTNRYTAQDIEYISRAYLSSSLDELSRELDRTSYGLAVKMRNLAREGRLDKYIVWDITRVEIKANKGKGDVKGQKKRWKVKAREKKRLEKQNI